MSHRLIYDQKRLVTKSPLCPKGGFLKDFELHDVSVNRIKVFLDILQLCFCVSCNIYFVPSSLSCSFTSVQFRC